MVLKNNMHKSNIAIVYQAFAQLRLVKSNGTEAILFVRISLTGLHNRNKVL